MTSTTMSLFGLDDADASTLIRAITSDDLDHDQLRERFARATWTGITEPGDRIAGIAIATMGATGTLEALVAGWTVDQWVDALATENVYEAELETSLERWKSNLQSSTAVLALRQAARYGARLITPDDAEWPTGLNDLGYLEPFALWVRGTDEAIAGLSRSITLTGTRVATGYGEHVTMEASAALVDRGFAIVSGASYGIDGMAHRAALASHGVTVAVLAGGVDRFYPSGHDALLTRMVSAGAVVSERPCGTPPTKWRIIMRNRMMAAASQATVIIEAPYRSGALNVAGHASEIGRPLGAVPGRVTDASSAGCHRLIRDYGAAIVTNADEIAELHPKPAVE